MLKIIRTTSDNPDLEPLIKLLDIELAITDGEEHSFYDQYNKLDKINHLLIAYKDNEPIGCGALKKFDDDAMEVKRMFVLNKMRGQGIAKEILSELENWAAELEFQKCILETGTRQPKAIALYKGAGYRIIPNYGQYSEMENSVCFEKLLSEK